MQPIQVGQLLQALQHEQDGLTTAFKSLGLDVAVAHEPRGNEREFYRLEKLSRTEYREYKHDTWSQKPESERVDEAEEVVAREMRRVFEKQGRLISTIRGALDEAKFNKEYTPEARAERIKYLKDTEKQVYVNVLTAYEGMVKAYVKNGDLKITEDAAKDLATKYQNKAAE